MPTDPDLQREAEEWAHRSPHRTCTTSLVEPEYLHFADCLLMREAYLAGHVSGLAKGKHVHTMGCDDCGAMWEKGCKEAWSLAKRRLEDGLASDQSLADVIEDWPEEPGW